MLRRHPDLPRREAGTLRGRPDRDRGVFRPAPRAGRDAPGRVRRPPAIGRPRVQPRLPRLPQPRRRRRLSARRPPPGRFRLEAHASARRSAVPWPAGRRGSAGPLSSRRVVLGPGRAFGAPDDPSVRRTRETSEHRLSRRRDSGFAEEFSVPTFRSILGVSLIRILTISALAAAAAISDASAQGALAQEPLPAGPGLTRRQAIDEAVARNPAITAAREQVEQARARVSEALAFPDPSSWSRSSSR